MPHDTLLALCSGTVPAKCSVGDSSISLRSPDGSSVLAVSEGARVLAKVPAVCLSPLRPRPRGSFGSFGSFSLSTAPSSPQASMEECCQFPGVLEALLSALL